MAKANNGKQSFSEKKKAWNQNQNWAKDEPIDRKNKKSNLLRASRWKRNEKIVQNKQGFGIQKIRIERKASNL